MQVYAIVVTAVLVALVAYLAGYRHATRRAAASMAALLFPTTAKDTSSSDHSIKTKPENPSTGHGRYL